MKLANMLHDLTRATILYNIDYDCFSKGQLYSKQWLVEILDDIRKVEKIHLKTIFVLCGWYGILPAMLFLKFNTIEKIRSFDIDPDCQKIADQVNKTYLKDDWRFKAVTEDLYNINFDKHSWRGWSVVRQEWSDPIEDAPDIIINTSCEHTDATWFKKVPDGKFVILQTNDSFEEKGHINAVIDLDDFKQMYPMKEIYYADQLKLEKFKRFMLMGIK